MLLLFVWPNYQWTCLTASRGTQPASREFKVFLMGSWFVGSFSLAIEMPDYRLIFAYCSLNWPGIPCECAVVGFIAVITLTT